MRIIYLGDNKGQFLRLIQDGIINLIETKLGLDNEKNLEEFCKMIYLLKKNFTLFELLENYHFISEVFKFTLTCIEFCKNKFI